MQAVPFLERLTYAQRQVIARRLIELRLLTPYCYSLLLTKTSGGFSRADDQIRSGAVSSRRRWMARRSFWAEASRLAAGCGSRVRRRIMISGNNQCRVIAAY